MPSRGLNEMKNGGPRHCGISQDARVPVLHRQHVLRRNAGPRHRLVRESFPRLPDLHDLDTVALEVGERAPARGLGRLAYVADEAHAASLEGRRREVEVGDDQRHQDGLLRRALRLRPSDSTRYDRQDRPVLELEGPRALRGKAHDVPVPLE